MRRHRTVGRLALMVFVFVLTFLGLTGQASAHAQLLGTDPHVNDVLPTAPQHVTLTFGEPVEVASNAIEVFDDHLKRVDDAHVARVSSEGNKIQVGLPANLRIGTYTVSWHVSSADTHPVSGTFRFSVGAPSKVTGNVPVFGRNDSAGFMLGIVRVLGYGGLILGPGALLVMVALWPAGLTLARSRRTLYVGLGLLGASAIGSMFLEGVWASGESLSAMWLAPSSLDSHSRKFDTLYAFRSYLLVLFGVLLVAVVSAQRNASARAAEAAARPRNRKAPAAVPRPLLPSWVMIAATVCTTLLLMVTWTLAGHPATGLQTPVAIGANIVHLLAMTIWLGGLAVLLISLRPAAQAADLAAVLPRFSRVAFACVLVLVSTGTYQAWREVGTIPALYRTTFGEVLLVKIGAVAAAIAMGALARRWVRRNLAHPAGSPSTPTPPAAPKGTLGGLTATLVREPQAGAPPESLPVRALHRGLMVEVAIAGVVLVSTAALVVTVPARESYFRPFTKTLVAPGLQVGVRIDRPRIGDTVLHLSARSSTGQPMPVTRVQAALSLPQDRLGPLPVRLANPAGSSVTGSQNIGLTFPRKGKWVIALTVQTSQFDASTFSVTVPVG